MRLLLRREQSVKGVMSKSVVFNLYARVDLTNEEKHNVEKYKLGSQVIYNSEASKKHLDAAREGGVRGLARLAMSSMSLNVTINSLVNGQQITCSTLDEVLGAEMAIRESCDALKRYVEVASTFDGREEVVELA